MPWMGMDPVEEWRWTRTLNDAENKARADAWAVPAELAARGAHISRVAPWLNSGTFLALMKGTGSMEPVERIAKMAALDQAQRNPTGLKPGSQVRGAQLNPGDRRLWAPLAQTLTDIGTQEQLTRSERDARRGYWLGGRGRTAGVSPLDDLVNQGVTDHQGRLIVPQRHYDQAKGEWVYEDEDAKAQGKAFDDFISNLPQTGKPIPALSNGEPGFYSPTTKIFTTQSQNAGSAGIPGLLTTAAGAFASPIGEYLQSHRLPVLPGTENVPTVGKPITEIPSSYGQGVSNYLESHRPPELPGTGSLLAAQPAGVSSRPENLKTQAQDYFMALNAPYQEFQGVIRNTYGAATGRDVDWWEPQSDLGIVMGTGMNPGDGLFVDTDSEVAKERRRREAKRGLINGQRVTLGRIAAAGASDLGIIDPNDTAYRVMSGLVDAGMQIYADPAVLVLNRLNKVQEARTLFKEMGEGGEGAGLIKGLFTGDIHRPTAEGWLNGREGTGVVEAIAKEPRIAEINRLTGRKLEKPELVALADADTPDKVRTVLKPMLGKQFRSTRDIWAQPGFLNPARYMDGSVRDWGRRELMDIPASFIDPFDDKSVINETERWLLNSHVTPEATDHFVDRIARATTPDGTLDALGEMMKRSDGVLAANGVPTEIRSRLTDKFFEELAVARKSYMDQALDHFAANDEVALAEAIKSTGDPFMWVEHSSHIVPLPDARAFRRLSSEFPNWGWNANGQFRWPAKLIDHWQNDIWKPFTLLRGAWPVRVVGEEQFRMAAADWASIFNHPISAIAWAISRRSDALEHPFQEAKKFQESLSHGPAGWFGDVPGKNQLGREVALEKGQRGYTEARAAQIIKMWHDDVANKVANSDTIDEAFDWFRNSEQRANYIRHQPRLQDDAAARAYLEITSRRMAHYTGGDDELLDAIRTGKFRGEDLLHPDTLKPSGKLMRALSDDLYDSGPDVVVGVRDAGNLTRRNQVTDKLFGWLMAKPTNFLSRSPMFRQAYWRRIEEMMSYANPEAKAQILQGARKELLVGPGPEVFKLGSPAVRRIERIDAVGRLTANEIDSIAKGYALDTVQNLLYDLTKRSQVADQMRLVAPFAEAWREVITRWANLANPVTPRGARNLRRFQQIVQGARGTDLGQVVGSPLDLDGRHQGFFWKDEYGEEVFVYPGSQWLTGQKWAHLPDWVPAMGGMGAPGIPIPLTGRVQGLSMFGTIIPGIGPAAAIPVSWFLPDKPGVTRTVRDWLLPYGSISDEEGQSALFNVLNFAPPWMQTAFQGLLGGGFDTQTNRLYANATMSAANYLYSTGRYDTSSIKGQQELMHDAKKASRNLYLVRALAAFGAPAAPKADWLVETNDRAIRLAALRDDYYNMLADPKIGPTKADEEFLKRWGEQTGMTMQAFTREIQGGVGVSQAFGDWERAHGDVKAEYPSVWAFFGPQEGKFDYPTYLHQILTGQREQLTLEEWMRLGQHHLGSMQIDKAQAMMPESPTDADNAWLDQVKDWVYRNYPGYNNFLGLGDRGDREVVMRELERAVKDKRVNHTEAGKALVQYMGARSQVLDTAHSLGLKTINSQTLTEDRAWLFESGQWLSRNYPDFKALWNRWLRSEVEAD